MSWLDSLFISNEEVESYCLSESAQISHQIELDIARSFNQYDLEIDKLLAIRKNLKIVLSECFNRNPHFKYYQVNFTNERDFMMFAPSLLYASMSQRLVSFLKDLRSSFSNILFFPWFYAFLDLWSQTSSQHFLFPLWCHLIGRQGIIWFSLKVTF